METMMLNISLDQLVLWRGAFREEKRQLRNLLIKGSNLIRHPHADPTKQEAELHKWVNDVWTLTEQVKEEPLPLTL